MAGVGVELWLLAYSGAGGTSSEEEKGALARDWRRSLRQGSSFSGSSGGLGAPDGEGLEATGVQVARSSVATAEALACFSGARTTGIGRPPWRLRAGGRKRRRYGHGGEVRATGSWWGSTTASLCGNEGDELQGWSWAWRSRRVATRGKQEGIEGDEAMRSGE
ncbi:hypothetical protein TRIUR3_28000 [Triticum urartu]|uniref:Uncharacterized protein n=1 Tax=Triticum urartu TaxID=4572 RepID=M7Z8K6_TRIUA|nr:hypothetical protein TRIUR3_28000 [Triticum urartu]